MEMLLQSKGVVWIFIRFVYIYGFFNYNFVEEWFFQCFKEGCFILVFNFGMQIMQFGYVKDLVRVFVLVLVNEKVYGQIYNISGVKYVIFDGIVKVCVFVGGFFEF